MPDNEDLLSDEPPLDAQKEFFDLRIVLEPLAREWPDGLFLLRGSKTRLDGLVVYHDFVWKTVLTHGKAMFKQGQTLACLVRKDCPDGKTPALLLTTQKQVVPGVRETEQEYIAVVNIHEYLGQSSNHAESYFTSKLKAKGKSVLEALREVERHPEELRTLVSKYISSPTIEQWIDEDPTRLSQLTSIVDRRHSDPRRNQAFENLLGHLAGIHITGGQVNALVKLLTGESQLSCLVSALAERANDLKSLPRLGSDDGRRMVAAALRASHRADAVKELKRMIAEDALEIEFQRLLDANWWMLGTQYVERMLYRHLTVDENIDILLRSACGFYDLVELKRSHEDIFRVDHDKYIVSSPVNNAVNQTAHYIAEIEANRSDILRRKHFDPFKLNGIVLIGNLRDDDRDVPAKREALRMYNSHLHRIRVITYDELVTIAEQVICANEGEIQYAAGAIPAAVSESETEHSMAPAIPSSVPQEAGQQDD